MRWTFRNIAALALGIGACAGAAGIVIHATTYASHEPPTAESIPIPPGGPGTYPARIIIPTLSIDAPIERVGLTDDGRMRAPRKFAEAAWFAPGTIPGAPGDALIAGHKDNGLGLDGVFADLSRLAPGDEIRIVTADGDRVDFTVASMQTYPYDAPVPPWPDDRLPTLSLITCSGKWVHSPAEGMTYDRRLVVHAIMNGS